MFRSLLLSATVCVALSAILPATARADDPAALSRALSLAGSGDWAGAMSAAQKAGPVGATVIEWQRLRDGAGTFPDYLVFVRNYPDWPGIKLLRKQGEAMIGTGQPSDAVISYFSRQAPQTGAGCLALATAYAQTGDFAAAEAEAIRGWRTLSLSKADEAEFLARYGEVLKEHHGGRMAALLETGNIAEARRMLPLVGSGTRAIANARIALQSDGPGIDAALAEVPARLAGSPGLALDRFLWRIRKDKYDEAIALLLERSASVELLGVPDAWADWRRKLARREMRLGDDAKAYKLASRHHLDPEAPGTEADDYADLEWLSGYIALRKLNDPETALKHFRRIRTVAKGPISLARAGYWEGRAYEVLGRDDKARAAYGEAAMNQTAFYGLLSAERLGLPMDPALTGGETYPDWKGQPFARSSVFAAMVALHGAGADDLASRFALHLASTLDGRQIGALAGLALQWKQPKMALSLAKIAADKGTVWPTAYFPLNGIEDMRLPVKQSLALAIARRESEFDPSVVSPVGARGLMQVMPGTAKMMAPKVGLAYEPARLTGDWKYNVALGSAYLAGLVDEFGPSPVLVAVGYNAGPGRSRNWIRDLGDPRSDQVDVVDWVEHIPFRETQNYVMRVAESLPIYRARITGKTEPVTFTSELKGR